MYDSAAGEELLPGRRRLGCGGGRFRRRGVCAARRLRVTHFERRASKATTRRESGRATVSVDEGVAGFLAVNLQGDNHNATTTKALLGACGPALELGLVCKLSPQA